MMGRRRGPESRRTTVPLGSGERLTVRVCEPPFPGGGKDLCWWRDVSADLMAGKLRPWLYTPWYLGEIDGERAGYMSCWTPADSREIGLVEFVWTAEAHRRKGIASILLGRLVKDFTRAGGLALYLCTTNPHAGRLYESRGFRYLVGDGMRYLAPGAGEFDRDYLGGGGPAVVRDATLGDLPRAAALFNHPEPRWIVKDSLSRCFHDTRYESHFLKTFLRLEGGKGVCVALENAAGRLVGLATAERRDTFAEQHTGVLSFRVAPAFTSRTAALLGAAVERSAALGIAVLHVHAADCDEDQKQLLEEAGFAEEARYQDRLRAGGGFVDLVIYGRRSSPPPEPSFDEGEYYGGRQPWQRQRAVEESTAGMEDGGDDAAGLDELGARPRT